MVYLLEFPLAGLVLAIHAFSQLDRVFGEDVGGRTKPGQGGSWVAAFER
jgi:hypothetical protein